MKYRYRIRETRGVALLNHFYIHNLLSLSLSLSQKRVQSHRKISVHFLNNNNNIRTYFLPRLSSLKKRRVILLQLGHKIFNFSQRLLPFQPLPQSFETSSDQRREVISRVMFQA